MGETTWSRWLFVMACGLGGCDPVLIPGEMPPDAAGAARVDVLTIKAIQNPDLDLLFVIDDSPSMLDKQNALLGGFPEFLHELAAVDGGLPSLHLGVISTDMGTKASSSPTPASQIGSGPGSCSASGKAGALQTNGSTAFTGKFITDLRTAGARTKNYTGTLDTAFASAAGLGASGCGFEQPLAALRASFGHTDNATFFRDDANLAIIMLTDEDDCSVHDPAFFGNLDPELGPLQSFRCFTQGVVCAPDDATNPGTRTGCKPRENNRYMDNVAPYADAVALNKRDARKLMLGTLIGDPNKVAVEIRTPPGGGTAIPALARACSWQPAQQTYEAGADPAVRLDAFAAAFPGRTKQASICSDDLRPALAGLGGTVRRLVGDPCLERDTSDLASCVVVDISDSNPSVEVQLPSCVDTPHLTCYNLIEDTARCGGESPRRLEVLRKSAASADTWTTVRCTPR